MTTLTWISFGITLGFGMLNLYQFLRDRFSRDSMALARGNFAAISDLCKNALKSSDLISNPEAVRQTLIAIRYMARSGNSTLDVSLTKRPARVAKDEGE